MNTIVDNFFNIILDSDEKDFDGKVDEFESQYKSFLLKKNGIKILNKNNIIKYIDYFKERNLANKNDYNWALKIDSLKYDSKFKIIVPTFSPKEIINLFVLKNINDNLLVYGFYAKYIFRNNDENCNKFLNHEFNSYSDCLKKIFEIYINIFKIDFSIEKEWNTDKIKNLLNKGTDKNKKFLNLIYELLNEIENINKQNLLNISYDDFFFLTEKNWYINLNEKKLKYPSLFFYLIKNPKIVCLLNNI